MHQYAHIPNGKTIHSAGQLEHHGITVDDRSHINGGNSRWLHILVMSYRLMLDLD